MADPADIATALLAHVANLVTTPAPALLVSYPDVPFTPPASGKYLDVSIFYNRPAWEGLSEGRHDQGLLQVSVVWPEGKGIVKAMEVAAQVMAHFPKGLNLGDGVKVSGQPYASSPILEDASTRVPVTIPWTA
ncbi:phage tail terminator-like protein [Brevundimonas sp. Root1279]|uniref:phage tail terminator-like protein n=1 Tax=Brevundimonas sp. Root1279 TaxID=1736443 RepID=UPI0006FF9A01|nr:phage tail terminator-like protein [Brevundimonas sp. Root1279]KQW79715.1 hypothetical protein ASC65_14295 [Brevundimonas sp. Root1279]